MKKLLLSIAIFSLGFSSEAWSRTLEKIPYGEQNEYTALWLSVPHVYQFDRSINPNKYYWCGQAAITTVMEYSGITPEYNSTTGLKAIHEWLRKNKTSTYNESYFAREDIKEICPRKYCADIDELRAAARALGMGSSIKKSVQLNNEAVFQQIIGGIEQKRPMIVPSWYDLQNESGAGHFWVIAGIVNKGNSGNSVLLLENVASSQGNARWDKKVLVKDFVSGLESYRKKNGWSTSSFNMLILK